MPDQSLGTISAVVRLNLKTLSLDVLAAKGMMGELGAGMQQKMGGLATQAGTIMTGVGVAITGALGLAAKSAADFDQSLRNVDSIAKLTTSEFKALHDSVMFLAGDKNIRQGPNDLAKALYEVYSSGFSGQKALDVLKVSAYGASAGMTDTATSSKALMAVLNSGIGGVHSAKEAMDVLFREVDLGVNTFGELATQIGDVLPMARVAGVSLQEVAAGMAVMTRGGINAAESVTALNQLINHIVKPSKGAAKTMDELGIAYGAAALQSKGLSGWLADVEQKTHGNTQAMVQLMPEIRGMKALLSLTKDDGKVFNQMLDGMKTAGKGAGSTMGALERQNRGATAQFQIFMKEVERLGIAIGEVLLPFLRQLVGGLTSIVKWFSGLPAPVRDTVVVMTALAGAVLLIGGPILILIGSLASMSAALVLAGTTLGAVAAAAAPFIGWIVAIGAAVALLVLAWRTNFGGIRTHFEQFVAWIKPYWTAAWNAISHFFKQVWAEIGPFLKQALDGLMIIVKFFGDQISKFWRANGADIMAIVKFVWDRISGIVQAILSVIAGLILAALRAIRGDWKGAWDAIKEYSGYAFDGLKRTFSGGMEALAAIIRLAVRSVGALGRAFVDGLINGIRGNIGELRQTVQVLSQVAVDAAKITLGIHSPSTVMEEVGRETAEGFRVGLQSQTRSIQEAVKSFFGDAAAEAWKATQAAMKENRLPMLEAASQGGQALAAGGEAVSDATEGTREQLSGWKRTLKTMADEMTNVFEGAFVDLFEHGWGKFFDDVLKGFAQMLEQMVAQLLAKAVIFGFLDLITGGGAGGILGSFGSFLGFDDWGNDREAQHWGFDYADHFTRGIKEFAGRATPAGGKSGGQTIVQAPITLHATINHEMDIKTVAERLAWHMQTRGTVYQGTG